MTRYWAAGLICGALTVAMPTARAQVSEAYIFSTWTSPANETAPAFTFTGTDGVALTLNGAGVGVGQTDIVDPVSVEIGFAFEYWKHTGTLNAGESFANMAGRVNSEISRWDDAGFFEDGTGDAPLNVDFKDGAKLYLQKFECAIPYLIIAEDAGLDPFKLWWDADGDFSSGAVVLFDGLNTSTRNAVLARSDIGADDSGDDIDHVYLFKFADLLQPGYLKIQETLNYNGALLEIDFIGSKCIPEPTTALTVGMGIGLLALLGRRRR